MHRYAVLWFIQTPDEYNASDYHQAPTVYPPNITRHLKDSFKFADQVSDIKLSTNLSATFALIIHQHLAKALRTLIMEALNSVSTRHIPAIARSSSSPSVPARQLKHTILNIPEISIQQVGNNEKFQHFRIGVLTPKSVAVSVWCDSHGATKPGWARIKRMLNVKI